MGVPDRLTIIAVVYICWAPLEVAAIRNFKCVVYNWDVNMTCSWTRTGESENIYLQYNLSDGWKMCPSLSPHRTSCVWDGNSRSLRPLSDLTWKFRINGNNTVQMFELKPEDCVKPDPVKNLKIKNTGHPTCVNVSWDYRNDVKKIAYVKYASEWDKKNNTIVKTELNRKETCGLIPNTHYTFSIIVRPEYKGYDSGTVTKLHKTAEDVPAAAPPIAVGSYEREINSCITKNSFYDVTVYWKEIPAMYRYGDITGYNLTFVDDMDMYKNTWVNEGNILWDKVKLMCERSYKVILKARTSKGISKHTSSILITMATDKAWYPPDVLVIMEKIGTGYMYNISWTDEAITDQHGYNYTVHYCPKSVVTCKEELQSICVSAVDRFYVLHLAYPPPLLIGVSMDRGQMSSGVKFTSCIYNKIGVPATPKDIKVAAVLDNSLTVTWTSTSRCDGVLPYVVSYRIYWCEVDTGKHCTGDVFSVAVRKKKSTSYRYIIKGLKKDQTYGTRLQALSNYKQSTNSSMYLAVPTNSDLGTWAIGGIVVASLVACVLCSFGLFSCIRCCRRKRRELKELDDVEIPYINTEYRRLQQHESQNPTPLPARGVISMATDRDHLLPKHKDKKGREEKVSLDSGRGSFPEQGSMFNEAIDVPIMTSPTLACQVREETGELLRRVTDNSFGGVQKPGNYSLFAAVDDSSGSVELNRGNYTVCDYPGTDQQTINTADVLRFGVNSDVVISCDKTNIKDKNSKQFDTLTNTGNDFVNTLKNNGDDFVEIRTPTSIMPSAHKSLSVEPEDFKDSLIQTENQLSNKEISGSVATPFFAEETPSGKVSLKEGGNSLQDYVIESVITDSRDIASTDVMETSFIKTKQKDSSVKFSDFNGDIVTNSVKEDAIVSQKV